jgi:hypothetical protein
LKIVISGRKKEFVFCERKTFFGSFENNVSSVSATVQVRNKKINLLFSSSLNEEASVFFHDKREHNM